MMFLVYMVVGFAISVITGMAYAAHSERKGYDYAEVYNYQLAIVGILFGKIFGEKTTNKVAELGQMIGGSKLYTAIWAVVSCLWWPIQVIATIATYRLACEFYRGDNPDRIKEEA